MNFYRRIAAFLFLTAISNIANARSHDLLLGQERCETDASQNASKDVSQCYESNFNTLAALPLSKRADAAHTHWSDTYWPNYVGGIAYRWQTKKTPWGLPHPDLLDLHTMSPDELKKLSPAEKFDIYRALKSGQSLDYTLTHTVLRSTDPKEKHWEGICHGWSPASINHPEPLPVSIDVAGVHLEFGSSDIKALLDYYYGVYAYDLREVEQVGSHSRRVDAGDFHLILANQLGKLHRGFVVDIDPTPEIWNQPVVAVDFQYSGQDWGRGKDGSREKVHVTATLHYIKESAPTWQPNISDNIKFEKTHVYQYVIKLDHDGMITGGEWISTPPDFIWTVKPMKFENIPGQPEGDFSALNDLYRPVMNSHL